MKNIRFFGIRIDPVAFLVDSMEADHRGIEAEFWREVSSYGEDGHVYRMKAAQPMPTFSWLQHFLARFGHNPRTTLGVAWIKGRSYELADLRTRVLECVEATDDLYLGFHTEDQIRERIASCESFEQLHEFCFEMIAGPADAPFQ